jgi:hypothetical protein
LKFARWLNSLDGVDFLIIIILLGVASYLTHRSLRLARAWYEKKQQDNPYATEFRASPFIFVGVTLPYLYILYNLLAATLRIWLERLFG